LHAGVGPKTINVTHWYYATLNTQMSPQKFFQLDLTKASSVLLQTLQFVSLGNSFFLIKSRPNFWFVQIWFVFQLFLLFKALHHSCPNCLAVHITNWFIPNNDNQF
jgi:hypothetical protein